MSLHRRLVMSAQSKPRAAATRAVQKISQSVGLMNTWSGASGDNTDDTLACELSDLDNDSDYDGRRRPAPNKKQKLTKPRRVQKEAPVPKVAIPKKVAVKKAAAKKKEQREATRDEVDSTSSELVASDEIAAAAAHRGRERQRQRHERRKLARQVHSDKSMVLSRRISQIASPEEQEFSPIAAVKLRFTPDATPPVDRNWEGWSIH